MTSDLHLRCGACGASADALAWRCPSCSGVLDLVGGPVTRTKDLPVGGSGLWRFGKWLPVAPGLSLGEPTTPLLDIDWGGTVVTVKNDGLLPTGSFKDRGHAVLVSWLVRHAARTAVTDSSGNAGASLAAYCAKARIRCHVYVPHSASPAKLAQIHAYGGVIHAVAGSRQDVAKAAMESLGDAAYVAHAWSPVFLSGTRTIAFELWEQLGGAPPDAVVVPVGAGTLLLGVATGFTALRTAGLVTRIPRIYGVQSESVAPLARASAMRRPEPVAGSVETTAAEGIRVPNPPRGRQILRAVADSQGMIIAVDDDALWRAHEQLGRRGLYVEPTSAVAAAGLSRLLRAGQITPGERVVVPITATGLKSAPPPPKGST